jgi:hypothetical protein
MPARKHHAPFTDVTLACTNCFREPCCAEVMTEALMVFRGIFFGVVLSLIMWGMAAALIANIV